MLARSLALVLACASGAASAMPSIYITTDRPVPAHVKPPQAPVDLSLIERVHDVAIRANVRYQIHHYPWKRAYAVALTRKDGCVYATSRTPEREASFKWVGPLYERTWVLAGRAGHDYRIKTLEDARKYRIGTFLGDAEHEYLRERGFNVDAAQTDSVNPDKLLLGRIDLWASAISRSGQPEFAAWYPHAIVPVLKFNTVGLYLACNKAVPDAVIARLNAAAVAMHRDLARAQRKVDPPAERRSRRPPCLIPGSPETDSRVCN